jgi:hypothetical protein
MEGDKGGQATFGLLSSKNQLVAFFSTPLVSRHRTESFLGDLIPTTIGGCEGIEP